MSRSSYKPEYPVVTSLKSGKHLVKISKIGKLGEQYSKDGNTGVLVKFVNDDISHEELYYIGGHNYSKLLKLFKVLDMPIEITHNSIKLNVKDLKEKEFWIVIKHVLGAKKRTELVSVHDKEPNVPLLIEEYE